MLSLQNRKLVVLWKLLNDEVTLTVIALGFLVLDQADFSGMTCLLFLETQTPAVCTGLPRVFFSSETLCSLGEMSVMSVSQYTNQISSQRVSVLLLYQYNDVLYSEAAEMFLELNTVLKKKKKNPFTVVQCLVSSTAGKLRNSHTKRKDKKSSFSLYRCSSTMLFSPVFQHSLLLNVLYCVSSHQIL